MKRSFIFLLLLVFISRAFGQNENGVVKGSVVDSTQKPLEFANVLIYKLHDTVVNKKIITNAQGIFRFAGLPTNDSMVLVISFSGYQNFRQRIAITGGQELDLGRIQLKNPPKLLDTILVKAQLPVMIIRNDTIEYNAEAIKVRPNAVVEELLKKLPGLEVDANGNITFNGKKISKLLVDGKVFFNGDLLLTTRNLPADMVSKVQVMDSKSLEQIFNNRTPNSQEKTLNIKLKRSDKNTFGFLHGGAGTDSRYEASGMGNYFDGSKKISVIGSGNNINNVGFTGSSELGIINPGNGIIESRLLGLNYSDDWGTHIKANGSYFYDRVLTRDESEIARKQLIVSDSTFDVNSQSRQTDQSNGHRLQFNIEYLPDSSSVMTTAPEFNTRNLSNYSSNNVTTYTGMGQKINESGQTTNTTGTSNSYLLNLFWGKKLSRNGRSITISSGAMVSNTNTNSLNLSKNTFYKDGVIDSLGRQDQRIFTDVNNRSYNLSVTYNEPVNKYLRLTFNESLNSSYSFTNKKTFITDSLGNVQSLNNDFSGEFTSRSVISSTNFTMEFTKKKWNLSSGLTAIYNNLENATSPIKNNLKQSQFNYSPVVNAMYHLDNFRMFQFNYSATTQQATLEQLQPVPDNSNPLYAKAGNPNLKPAFFQNYSFTFSKFNATENLNIGFQYAPVNNKIVNAIFYDDYGRQISQYVNVDGNYLIGANAMVAKNIRFESYNMRFTLGLNVSHNKDVMFVNKSEVIAKTNNLSIQFIHTYNFKDIVSANVGYNYSCNNVHYIESDQQNTSYAVHNANGNIAVSFLKTFKLLTECVYTYNTNVAPGFDHSSLLWNLGVTKSLFKSQQGQVKFVIYDILKANNNMHRNISNNYIEDTQSTILPQYMLLSLTYHYKNGARNKKGR